MPPDNSSRPTLFLRRVLSSGVRRRYRYQDRSDAVTELSVHQSALLKDLALCVNSWRPFSPGWDVCVLTDVQLSPDASKVPGLVAMVNYGWKKPCEADDDALYGPANFVLDVFCSK